MCIRQYASSMHACCVCVLVFVCAYVTSHFTLKDSCPSYEQLSGLLKASASAMLGEERRVAKPHMHHVRRYCSV